MEKSQFEPDSNVLFVVRPLKHYKKPVVQFSFTNTDCQSERSRRLIKTHFDFAQCDTYILSRITGYKTFLTPANSINDAGNKPFTNLGQR